MGVRYGIRLKGGHFYDIVFQSTTFVNGSKKKVSVLTILFDLV